MSVTEERAMEGIFAGRFASLPPVRIVVEIKLEIREVFFWTPGLLLVSWTRY
jgi:hypothetical protein